MEELKVLRDKIDEIDFQLISLFEERMKLVKSVAEYKISHKTKVYQGDREKEVVEKAVANIKDKNLVSYAESFIFSVMDLSKDYQRHQISGFSIQLQRKPLDLNAKVGYFGVEGSNTEKAAIDFFGSRKHNDFEKLRDVFEAIEKGQIIYGVIPIENSSTGAINDVYDLMNDYDCYIVGEIWERISHHLFGVEGTTLDSIKEVFSHTQALGQCSEYLDNKGWKKVPYFNTAIAAKKVKEWKDISKVAIASKRAGDLYGLNLIESDIQTQEENFTRFIIVSKYLLEGSTDKASIEFSLSHKPGTLCAVLKHFSKYGINMSSICSRPLKNMPGRYNFYIDFEKENFTKQTIELISGLSDYCESYKLLGEYNKGGFYE